MRELAAAEPGRSKSSLATDLKRARQEERARLDAERAVTQEVQPEPERKPAASVLRLDGGGHLRRSEGTLIARPRALVLPRPRYSEGLAAVMESNEHVQPQRVANVRAGLSATGMASYQTSLGRGSYSPDDPQDVERVRVIIRADEGDEAADSWLPHPGL